MILSFPVESPSIHFHLGMEKNTGEEEEEKGDIHSLLTINHCHQKLLFPVDTIGPALPQNFQLALNGVVEVDDSFGKLNDLFEKKSF